MAINTNSPCFRALKNAFALTQDRRTRQYSIQSAFWTAGRRGYQGPVPVTGPLKQHVQLETGAWMETSETDSSAPIV